MELITSLLWLAIVLLLIARALGQRGLLHAVKAAAPPPEGLAERVAIIIPARDEAANIERGLRSLLTQTYPMSRLRLVVVDDHSADATLSKPALLASAVESAAKAGLDLLSLTPRQELNRLRSLLGPDFSRV